MSKTANRQRIVIIGGGVAGCHLAFELSKFPAEVTLIEQGRIGRQGASSLPVALINPYRGRSGRASELDLAGLASFWRVAEELRQHGYEPGTTRSGVLRIASNRRQANSWQKLSGVRWLESQEVPAIYNAPYGGFMVEQGGWVMPNRLLGALVAAARQRGVRILENCRAGQLETHTGTYRIANSCESLEADLVVFCVGADDHPSLAPLGVERVAGDMIGLSSKALLPLPIAGAVYGASRGEQTFVGGNHRPIHQEDPSAPEKLRNALGWFAPHLKRAPQTNRWTGVRARQADRTPLLEQLGPGLWVFGALAGRGFLCSAHLSRQLAGKLLV
ncbi:MAG: FAD-binding oxidoreductase [Trueperaceae bacterium]|nr:MAG: FAD-binding oxidoreductase [Trueperaceae bacterium]